MCAPGGGGAPAAAVKGPPSSTEQDPPCNALAGHAKFLPPAPPKLTNQGARVPCSPAAGGRHLLRQLPQWLRRRRLCLLVPLRRRSAGAGDAGCMPLAGRPLSGPGGSGGLRQGFVHACVCVCLCVFTVPLTAPGLWQHARLAPQPLPRAREPSVALTPAPGPGPAAQVSPTSARCAPAAPSLAAKAAAASPPSPAAALSSASGRRAAATTATLASLTQGTGGAQAAPPPCMLA